MRPWRRQEDDAETAIAQEACGMNDAERNALAGIPVKTYRTANLGALQRQFHPLANNSGPAKKVED